MLPQDIIGKYQLDSLKQLRSNISEDRIIDLSSVDHLLNLVLYAHKYYKGQNIFL